MSKPTVSAKDVVRDVRGGMDNAALKEKYKLTDTGLQSLFKKLLKAGLLDQSEVAQRFKDMEPKSSDGWQCPACGSQDPEVWQVCPRCGVDVADYEKQQAERAKARSQAHGAASSRGPESSAAPTGKRCPHCSEVIHQDAVKCKHCGAWIDGPSRAADDSYDDDWEGEAYCPWEDAEEIGWFEAFKQTISGVLFRPAEFFSQVPRRGGYGQPLLFGVILTSLGLVLGQLWSLMTGHGFVWYLVPLAPIVAVIGIGISTGVYHLCLYLLGGASEDIEASWRVMCYATATSVWNVIPLVGSIVAAIWQIVAIIIGLREVHETTTGKAALAVFLPLIVCCSLVLILIFTLGFMGAMSR
jgi:ribosomal protein L37AE/L43A